MTIASNIWLYGCMDPKETGTTSLLERTDGSDTEKAVEVPLVEEHTKPSSLFDRFLPFSKLFKSNGEQKQDSPALRPEEPKSQINPALQNRLDTFVPAKSEGPVTGVNRENVAQNDVKLSNLAPMGTGTPYENTLHDPVQADSNKR